MKRLADYLGRGAAAVLVMLLSLCLATARVLDPGGSGPEAALLTAWAGSLDAAGVDVVLGSSLALVAPKRPRVAALSGYAPKRTDWGEIEKEGWVLAFNDGRAGTIFAVRQTIPTMASTKQECDRKAEESEACSFVSAWIKADPKDRVFVAFTNADFDAASAVKRALERQGYTVFMFLQAKNAKPWADAAVTGEAFAQAAHRLVIDTEAARGSPGISFESLCCEWKLVAPPSPTKWSEAIRDSRMPG